MPKYPKHLVLTENGTEVRMNDAALRIAERHFGVNRIRQSIREVPIEVLRMPKVEITKAVPKPEAPKETPEEIQTRIEANRKGVEEAKAKIDENRAKIAEEKPKKAPAKKTKR